ncbi:hypothetical protein BJ508DRAFT_416530 [Ascobolus immersus RN42]|uniref:Uncharacterized protein n=1 Tax=Ascobolus immersus RN42 TaxID=1160509 RepID=A0A3N4HZM2_ASCIM|nr:hypothetical protein BJ508DRAFT_416530 [Ascobolus immersus RN42]
MSTKPARAAKQSALSNLAAQTPIRRKRKSVSAHDASSDIASDTGTESVVSGKGVKRTRSSLAGPGTPMTPTQQLMGETKTNGFTPINSATAPKAKALGGGKKQLTLAETKELKDLKDLTIRTKAVAPPAAVPAQQQAGGETYGKGNIVATEIDSSMVESWDDVPEKIPPGPIRWLTLMAPKESVREYCINPQTGLPPSPTEDDSLFILQRFTYVPRPIPSSPPPSSALSRSVAESAKGNSKKPKLQKTPSAPEVPTVPKKKVVYPKGKGPGKGNYIRKNSKKALAAAAEAAKAAKVAEEAAKRDETPIEEKIHVPLITEYGYRRLQRIYREVDKRVPELNGIEMIYRDFAGYGGVEVMENEISEYEQMTRGGYVPIENVYHIIEGIVFFLSTPQACYWQKIDDTDRICELLWLVSHALADFHARFLAGSSPIVLQAVEYTYPNIGLLIGQIIYLLHQWRLEIFSVLPTLTIPTSGTAEPRPIGGVVATPAQVAAGRDPTRELRQHMEDNAVWSKVPLFYVSREDGKCRRWIGIEGRELQLFGAQTGLRAVQWAAEQEKRKAETGDDGDEDVDVVKVGGEFEAEWKGYTHGYGSGGKNFDLTREGLNKAAFKMLQV